MTEWLAANIAKVLAVVIVVALVAGLFALNRCSSARTAHTTSTLATGQAAAATETGKDAIDTIGNRAQTEATTDAISRENDTVIRNAEGASVVVAPGVSGAGISALCRRAAYQGDRRCAGAQ